MPEPLARHGTAPPLLRWIALSALLGAAPLLLLWLAVARGALQGDTAIALGVAVVLAYSGFAWWLHRTVWRTLGRAEALVGGEARPPAAWDAWTMLGELEGSVERLRRHLLTQKDHTARQSTAADAILNALPDPVLVLDSKRRVSRANAAARQVFGNEALGEDLAVTLRHPTALQAADAVLAGTQTLAEGDFQLPTAEGRAFLLRVVALTGGPGAESENPAIPTGLAAILALHDVTALRRAERMRADFVANASHELRTPLASLVGFIETLLGPARDDEAARLRFLGIMREQAARMSRLINDLLSLSQIEMREYDRPQGAVPLAPLLRELAAGLEPQARAKRMRLVLDLDESLPPAAGARDELAQVFQNLLDNAIKYGREETAVTVTLRRAEEGLEVSIRDQGEGIAREHLPRLTERFYRVDSARSRELGGTGLGLAIVKHIVSRHRGRLVIESELGAGSEFIVRLPFV